MEFAGATATLSKKLSNGYGVSGRSAYDGVFAAPVKLRAPSFSSRLEDYREVFGSFGASSIPVLEVPELKERKKNDDVRHSKLDYSKVFGGFGNIEAAMPFEELIDEPKHKKKNSFSMGASSERSKAKGGTQSCREDLTKYSKENPTLLRSSNDTNRINMSYLMVNQGSDVAQIHAVPAYTCLIEEVNPVKVNRDNPVKVNRDNKSVPVTDDSHSSILCNEGIKESGCCTKSLTDPSPDNTKKQSSNNGVNIKNRSDTIDLFFDASKISNGSKGAHHIKVPPSETVAGNMDNHNDEAVRFTATQGHASKRDRSEGSDSPSYLDDMVDSNSEAAASVAALRKAIEEAQVRMKVAKELMRRKKEGFPNFVTRKSNIDSKAEKKEDKISCKTLNLEEINMRQTFGETDALTKFSSELGKPTMRMERVRSDLGAKEMLVAEEAMQETLKKLISTQAKHKEEFELKEADDNATVIELKEVENNRKELGIKNTGRNASDKLEECDHRIEVIKEYWEHENNEEKVHAANEAGACEELVVEARHTYQEVVDETKLVQKTFDNGATDKRLRVNGEEEVENKVTPFHEQAKCESNLGEQELVRGDEHKVACKPEEDGKKIEGQKECQRNLRAIQELKEDEKNTDQEQKGNEEKVEVSSEPEECELPAFVEPMDKRACSPHRPDFNSLEREIENLGSLDDIKRTNETGFLDVNREAEHSCQMEGTESTFSNIYVHEMLEQTVDHIHDEEDIYLRIIEDSELDGNESVQYSKASKNEIEGAASVMDENEGEWQDNKEPVEVIRVSQTDPNYEDIKAEEIGMTIGTSSSYEPDEIEKWSKTKVSDTTVENDETVEVTPMVYSYDVQDDIMEASDASFILQEKYDEPESVQETNDFYEKIAVETSAFVRCAPEINETVNPMQSRSETVTFESDATYFAETDTEARKNQDQCMEEAENDCNPPMLSEETTTECIKICEDAKEARVALDEEIDENRSNSSNEEKLFDNEHNIEASQVVTMSGRISTPFKEEGNKTIHSNLEENHQAGRAMEEKESNSNPQTVDPEKEYLKKIDEAKEREREKEKLAVDRAIREARHRAFAEARERVVQERAAAEARQKKKSDGREGLGKTVGHANEKKPAEKAAMEAKLKAERAAVERATAEARARALERALSEKFASESRNKSDKSVAEQLFGASRDNGMKQNFHSKSFSYGVRDSSDVFDGANGDSAQRCKARSERHQRIGERVAKALSEKYMRDRVVQMEQEERNRIAEALDADVKRWSSGKTGNLRALLSTLQYILGPDSGWQPIPLTDIVMTSAVKKAYRKATLSVHPDKLQQRGASIQQKYICEKVFDLLKEAWNRFNMEER
ncbi:PREDICTED: auxilin-like protein 1 isoform X1 [Lupinus angustifolius]|uniref:auxilin-like protein 1 isoform X1 n=1 Tax=Lupinus angustifolius TaxID=3871 RepID=UPI00092F6AC6|nr:PREDICTED: auxilin-like protein 1 isoform X1 [Lupinus angustifolius]